MKNEIGYRLKMYRERAELSLNKLSQESGVSTDYIWKIESGKVTNVGVSKLKLLADALKISLVDLIDDSRGGLQ